MEPPRLLLVALLVVQVVLLLAVQPQVVDAAPASAALVSGSGLIFTVSNPVSSGLLLLDEIVSSADRSAGWIRLHFGQVVLPRGVLLTITSLRDGAQQHLDQAVMATWIGSSAYFNGAQVRVTLTREDHPLLRTKPALYRRAFGSAAALAEEKEGEEARLVIARVESDRDPAGQIETHPATEAEKSICYRPDTRVFTNDTRQGRYIPSDPNGCCTAWMIDDKNFCFLSAGHCTDAGKGLVEFNVPLSADDGTLVHPPPEHQYIVDQVSMQVQYSGTADWRYFGVFRNSETGLHPIEAYSGEYYKLKRTNTPAGSTIRITGYGENESFPKNERRVLKTATGPYVSQTTGAVRYRTDTSNGNSGSAIYDEEQGVAIGVHTLGGCSVTSATSYNSGVNIFLETLQTALKSPKGVCA